MAFSDIIDPHRNDGVSRARSKYGTGEVEEAKPKKEKPARLDPVVTRKVRVKKPGLISKFKDIFIANDSETVKDYVFNNIFVPGITDIFMDMVWGGLSMLFYEDARIAPRRARRRGLGESRYADRDVSRITREGASRGRRERSEETGRRRFDQLEFDDMAEAELVLQKCCDIIEDYDVLSIAEVLDICNEEHSYTDQSWGWEDISQAKVRRLGRGVYTINFPRAKRID